MYFRKIDKMVKLWNTIISWFLTTLPVEKLIKTLLAEVIVILAVRHISLYHNLFVCNEKLMCLYILR